MAGVGRDCVETEPEWFHDEWVNWFGGYAGRVYNAAGVGRLAKRHSVPYLLDACQSAGQMPLDVTHLGCDWLSATARKYLRGPRGMGFLYASEYASPLKFQESAHALSDRPHASAHRHILGLWIPTKSSSGMATSWVFQQRCCPL